MQLAFYYLLLFFKSTCSQSENTTFSTDHINIKTESSSNLVGNLNLPDSSLDERTQNLIVGIPQNSQKVYKPDESNVIHSKNFHLSDMPRTENILQIFQPKIHEYQIKQNEVLRISDLTSSSYDQIEITPITNMSFTICSVVPQTILQDHNGTIGIKLFENKIQLPESRYNLSLFLEDILEKHKTSQIYLIDTIQVNQDSLIAIDSNQSLHFIEIQDLQLIKSKQVDLKIDSLDEQSLRIGISQTNSHLYLFFSDKAYVYDIHNESFIEIEEWVQINNLRSVTIGKNHVFICALSQGVLVYTIQQDGSFIFLNQIETPKYQRNQQAQQVILRNDENQIVIFNNIQTQILLDSLNGISFCNVYYRSKGIYNFYFNIPLVGGVNFAESRDKLLIVAINYQDYSQAIEIYYNVKLKSSYISNLHQNDWKVNEVQIQNEFVLLSGSGQQKIFFHSQQHQNNKDPLADNYPQLQKMDAGYTTTLSFSNSRKSSFQLLNTQKLSSDNEKIIKGNQPLQKQNIINLFTMNSNEITHQRFKSFQPYIYCFTDQKLKQDDIKYEFNGNMTQCPLAYQQEDVVCQQKIHFTVKFPQPFLTSENDAVLTVTIVTALTFVLIFTTFVCVSFRKNKNRESLLQEKIDIYNKQKIIENQQIQQFITLRKFEFNVEPEVFERTEF